MANTAGELRTRPEAAETVESWASAVSWPAIIAGAFVMAAMTLVLLALGSGLGLAIMSPWRSGSPSPTAFGVGAAIGMIVVQWLSAGLGGYLTGRLRTKWARVHTHEVVFRDTANGFLAWAIATAVGALLAASAASAVIGAGVRATASVASGTAQGAGAAAASLVDASAYRIDTLFRPAQPDATPATPDLRTEAARILANGVAAGDVPAADRTYLAQLVAAHTGLAQPDAEKRVDDVISQAKAAEVKIREAADAARKSAATASILTALSMLIGAFIAAAAAALGGQQRDEHA